jgi:hypothetical protein
MHIEVRHKSKHRYVNRRFGGTWRLHLQGLKSTEQEISVQQIPKYYPEDGGDTFLSHVGSLTVHTAVYHRIWQHVGLPPRGLPII